jgi:hypothetical protein
VKEGRNAAVAVVVVVVAAAAIAAAAYFNSKFVCSTFPLGWYIYAYRRRGRKKGERE